MHLSLAHKCVQGQASTHRAMTADVSLQVVQVVQWYSLRGDKAPLNRCLSGSTPPGPRHYMPYPRNQWVEALHEEARQALPMWTCGDIHFLTLER